MLTTLEKFLGTILHQPQDYAMLVENKDTACGYQLLLAKMVSEKYGSGVLSI
jgi:hypothetical protein